MQCDEGEPETREPHLASQPCAYARPRRWRAAVDERRRNGSRRASWREGKSMRPACRAAAPRYIRGVTLNTNPDFPSARVRRGHLAVDVQGVPRALAGAPEHSERIPRGRCPRASSQPRSPDAPRQPAIILGIRRSAFRVGRISPARHANKTRMELSPARRSRPTRHRASVSQEDGPEALGGLKAVLLGALRVRPTRELVSPAGSSGRRAPA